MVLGSQIEMMFLEIRLKENCKVAEDYLYCVLRLYRWSNKNYGIIYLAEEISKQQSLMAVK